MGLGLYHDNAPALALSRYGANAHAEHITQAAGHLLHSQGVGAAELDAIGVAVGPGSFTGLRIAIAFVKGLAFGSATRILPVSSLQSAALAWPAEADSVVVAFEARRGEVFWARFSGGRDRKRLTPDAVCTGEAFMEALQPDDIVLTDTMGYQRSTVFAPLAARQGVCAIEDCGLARGLACAGAAAAEAADSPRWTTARDVMPVYLRVSYAEETRTQKVKALP